MEMPANNLSPNPSSCESEIINSPCTFPVLTDLRGVTVWAIPRQIPFERLVDWRDSGDAFASLQGNSQSRVGSDVDSLPLIIPISGFVDRIHFHEMEHVSLEAVWIVALHRCRVYDFIERGQLGQ